MLHTPQDAIHPGQILREEFLADYGLTLEKVAADTGIDPLELAAVYQSSAPVTAEMALRLSRYFSNSPEFWLNLQRTYDLSLALKTAQGLDKISPVRAA
ncbi:HigA family addiction module antidote protein [Rhizobium sp. CG5]|uniref:HigA family addiction module antitoxin n=1 Tax=Rhizobium sp. CG5 TaxID=2726076 RepID=UPI002034757B|nr:HigA family addiction module antitoxin [Rhizobium sp. CG5]MCM2474806.1 HigA family addiction module antidote protein [Rhizobium sp. CG5]